MVLLSSLTRHKCHARKVQRNQKKKKKSGRVATYRGTIAEPCHIHFSLSVPRGRLSFYTWGCNNSICLKALAQKMLKNIFGISKTRISCMIMIMIITFIKKSTGYRMDVAFLFFHSFVRSFYLFFLFFFARCLNVARAYFIRRYNKILLMSGETFISFYLLYICGGSKRAKRRLN